MKFVVPFLLSSLFFACDTAVETENSGCTATIVGAHPGAALIPNISENPHLSPWVALRTSGKCSQDDIAGLNVQLFSQTTALAVGFADFVSFTPPTATQRSGCAIFEWPETKHGHGTADHFAIVVSPPISGTSTMLASQQIPSFMAEGNVVLPMWKVAGEWSMYLIHPLMYPACVPTPLD